MVKSAVSAGQRFQAEVNRYPESSRIDPPGPGGTPRPLPGSRLRPGAVAAPTITAIFRCRHDLRQEVKPGGHAGAFPIVREYRIKDIPVEQNLEEVFLVDVRESTEIPAGNSAKNAEGVEPEAVAFEVVKEVVVLVVPDGRIGDLEDPPPGQMADS